MGNTLHGAVTKRRPQALAELLERRTAAALLARQVEAKSGNTLLHLAVIAGWEELPSAAGRRCLELLVSHEGLGPIVDATNADGHTALYLAAGRHSHLRWLGCALL